jgi:GTPase SAR1 family protein
MDVNCFITLAPGHERFGGMTKVYYKYAHGALIVFDLSRPETFESALSWLTDVTEKVSHNFLPLK